MSKGLKTYWLAMLTMLFIAFCVKFGTRQDTGPLWVIIVTNTIWWIPAQKHKILQSSEIMKVLKQQKANLYALFSLSLLIILYSVILAFKFRYIGRLSGLLYGLISILLTSIVFSQVYIRKKNMIKSKEKIELL